MEGGWKNGKHDGKAAVQIANHCSIFVHAAVLQNAYLVGLSIGLYETTPLQYIAGCKSKLCTRSPHARAAKSLPSFPNRTTNHKWHIKTDRQVSSSFCSFLSRLPMHLLSANHVHVYLLTSLGAVCNTHYAHLKLSDYWLWYQVTFSFYMLEPWEVVLIHLVAGALLLMSAWTRYVHLPDDDGLHQCPYFFFSSSFSSLSPFTCCVFLRTACILAAKCWLFLYS